MITNQNIAFWSIDHPWQSSDQVEQDLLLSQAICVISNDSLLGRELVLRGGAAYHKLFLPQPYRYSYDIMVDHMPDGSDLCLFKHIPGCLVEGKS